MIDMKHKHMFINSLLPHLKYPFTTTKILDAGRGSAGNPTTGRKPVSADRSNH